MRKSEIFNEEFCQWQSKIRQEIIRLIDSTGSNTLDLDEPRPISVYDDPEVNAITSITICPDWNSFYATSINGSTLGMYDILVSDWLTILEYVEEQVIL